MTTRFTIEGATNRMSGPAVAPQGQQPNTSRVTTSTAEVADQVFNDLITTEQVTNEMLGLAVATQVQQPIGAVPANAPQQAPNNVVGVPHGTKRYRIGSPPLEV